MTDRDWDKELAAIDRQLASVSDEALATPATAAPTAVPDPRAAAGRPAAAAAVRTLPASDVPTPAGVLFRLALAVLLGVGVVFWPYANRCGVGLAGYLAAVLVVAGAGWWTAVTTWRARAGRAHVLALMLVAWGLILTAIEILPRVGYAADPARISWGCET
jgi:hypothetical protein